MCMCILVYDSRQESQCDENVECKNLNLWRACLQVKGQKISKRKYVVLDSSKKRTLGQFYVLKIAPVFVFWKNPGRHNLLLRFTDL